MELEKKFKELIPWIKPKEKWLLQHLSFQLLTDCDKQTEVLLFIWCKMLFLIKKHWKKDQRKEESNSNYTSVCKSYNQKTSFQLALKRGIF